MKNTSLRKTFLTYALTTYGTLIVSTILLVAFLVNNAINDSEKAFVKAELQNASNSLNNILNSTILTLKDQAKRSVVVNSLMQFDRNNLALIDYLNERSVLGDKGEFSLVSFDGEYLYGKNKFSKNTIKSIVEEGLEYKIEVTDIDKQEFTFYVPVIYAGSAEGVYIFSRKINLKDVMKEVSKQFNIHITIGEKIINVLNVSSGLSLKKSKLPKKSNVQISVSYDQYYFMKEKFNDIGLVYLSLLILLAPFALVFYRKGMTQFVDPHEKLVSISNRLDQINSFNDSILNSSKHMIIATDVNGIVTTFNDAAVETLGYSKEEVIGKMSPGAFHVDDEVIKKTNDLNNTYGINIEPGFETFIYVTKKNGLPEDSEWTYVRKDKTQFSVRLIVSEIKRLDETVGFLGLSEDLTELKEIERLEEVAKKEIEKVSILKSEFLANMSHEIRTPMNGVIGMADVLSTTTLDNEQREAVDLIRKSGEFLVNIINDILDFSKIESSKMIIESREFLFSSLLLGVRDLLDNMAKERNIDLILINEYSSLTFLGDEHRIQQVLYNFTSNALKFTPSDGKVTIKFEKMKNYFEMSVQDSGIGISEDKVDSLFDAFIQADASTTREYGGSGLGLAICKELSLLMGGDIKVESIIGEGSCFTLQLPLKGEVEGALNIIEEVKVVPFSVIDKFKILVVEDNKINQKVVISMLSKLNQDVDVADDGIEALELLKVNKYDLILMDMQMPRMDGITCSKKVRSLYGDSIYIVALTANAFGSDRDSCIEAGMNDFLTKPIKREILKNTLSKYQNSVKKIA